MNHILNACKYVLPIAAIAGILLGVGIAHEAQGNITTEDPIEAIDYIAVDELEHLNIDFDLNDEVLQCDTVLHTFAPNDPDGFYAYPNPQEVAAPYIPEDAVCTEVCIIGYVVSFDYRIENVRYITSYCIDETVRLTASVLAEEIDYVYEISSDDPDVVIRMDCSTNVITWENETTD